MKIAAVKTSSFAIRPMTIRPGIACVECSTPAIATVEVAGGYEWDGQDYCAAHLAELAAALSKAVAEALK